MSFQTMSLEELMDNMRRIRDSPFYLSGEGAGETSSAVEDPRHLKEQKEQLLLAVRQRDLDSVRRILMDKCDPSFSVTVGVASNRSLPLPSLNVLLNSGCSSLAAFYQIQHVSDVERTSAP